MEKSNIFKYMLPGRHSTELCLSCMGYTNTASLMFVPRIIVGQVAQSV
jgi:hypothetical protein